MPFRFIFYLFPFFNFPGLFVPFTSNKTDDPIATGPNPRSVALGVFRSQSDTLVDMWYDQSSWTRWFPVSVYPCEVANVSPRVLA